MKKRKSPRFRVFLKRLCAVFVIICFIASDLRAYADTASLSLSGQAVSPVSAGRPEISKAILSAFLPEAFTLPEELGSVQNLYRGSSSQTVLLIQDAHSQLEAQNSIQAILDYVREKYGFRLLFLEGGLEGPISSDLLRFYKNEAVNEQIAEKLLGKAAITGPGLFLLKHPRAVRAYGTENKAAYFGNIQSYRRVISSKPQADVFLKQLKLDFGTEASSVFNPALLTFTREWIFYKNSHQDLLTHLEVLKRAAEKHLSVSLENGRYQLEYPQLTRYFKLREIEKEIRLTEGRDKRAEERDALLAWVHAAPLRQPLGDFLKLVTMAGEDSGAEGLPRNARRVLETFFEEARVLGFKWEGFPSLNLRFAQTILSQEIQPDALYTEVDGVTSSILKKLTRTPEEKKLLKLFRRYEILHKLCALELSREEFLRLKQAGALMRPEALTRQLREMNPQAVAEAAPVEKIYDEALRFYALAVSREKTMMKAVTGVFEETGEEKAVLVAGGFHSAGLEAKLREKEISYVTLLPKISDLSPDENYTDQMMLRDRTSPRHSHVVQLGPDRVAIPDMPPRDGAFISDGLERVKQEVTKGLGALAAGPAEQLHAAQFLTAGSRAEARSPRERNLLGKGLSLGKVQKLVGESLASQAEGGEGLNYRRDLTQARLDTLSSGERVDTIRNRASEEQALHNLVKNALDWNVSGSGRRTAPENQSRFHGEGALGFLAELQEPDDYAVLESKSENGAGFRVTFWNKGTAESPLYQFYFEELPELASRGTQITVYKTFENWKERLENISERLSVNTAAPIFVNKKQINQPEKYDVLDPAHQKVNPKMNPVKIWVAKDGYRVTDSGTGMTEKEFFENFLHAGISEKENETLQRARKRNPEDTRVYSSHELANETQTEGWINGHRAAVFSHSGPKRLNLAAQWIVDFPPGTPHPNAGDNVVMDNRALQGLRSVIDRLTDAENEVENRFAQINSLAIYLRHIQPEAERARLGKRDLLKYLAERMKGRDGLIARLKASGGLRGRILVPNSLSAPDTLNGWAAFDHPKFIPLDEELFNFEFESLNSVTGKLTRQEREVLVGRNAVLNTIPIYAAGWGFRDKLRGMPAAWILDESGKPVLLIDSQVLRGDNPNLAMIAGILEFLAEKKLRAILSEKNIPLIEVAGAKAKKEKLSFFAWLNRWKKAVITAAAIGLFVIAPLAELARRYGSSADVPVTVTMAQKEEEQKKEKTQTPQPKSLISVPPKPAALPVSIQKPEVKKPGPSFQAPPAWIPATQNQAVNPAQLPAGNVQLPQTSNLNVPGGARRDISKKSNSPFQRQNNLKKTYRSGPQGTSVNIEGRGFAEAGEEEAPVYGFVENAVSTNGSLEALLTGGIFPSMDETGTWIAQEEVLKKVRQGAVPVNAKPIRVSLWGNVSRGDFPLLNYYTGMIRNVRVTLVNRKTNQPDENETQAFRDKWRHSREHITFDAFPPEGTFAKIEYDIDYYQPQDFEPMVSPGTISQKEKDDFKKYFGHFLDGVKDKSDAEKLQAVTDLVHRVLIYDMYATARQGALSVDRYASWSEGLADILTEGIDPKLEPRLAIEAGLNAGNIGRVTCNSVTPFAAAALDYLGIASAAMTVQHPVKDGIMTREEMAHMEMAIRLNGVYVKFDFTPALNYTESPAETRQNLEKGGVVTRGEAAEQKRTEAFQALLAHFEALRKNEAVTEAQMTAARVVLGALREGRRPSADSAKVFMQALEAMKNDSESKKKSGELAARSYAYANFIEDMKYQNESERAAEERKRMAEAVQSAKALMRDAQTDGFLTENEFNQASEALDLIARFSQASNESPRIVIQALLKASKDPRVAGQGDEVLEKLKTHFWEISYADALSYLDVLKMVLQDLHSEKALKDDELAALNGIVEQFWKDRFELKDQDYDFLSDWLDFLSQHPDHGAEIRKVVEKLDEISDFSKSRSARPLRAVESAIKAMQEKDKIQDEDITRVIELIRFIKNNRWRSSEEAELFERLNRLKNRYSDKEALFYFSMETLNADPQIWRRWAGVIEARDEVYLTHRLTEVLSGAASEAEVREFTADTMKFYRFKDAGAVELLKSLEKWTEIKDLEELKTAFTKEKEKMRNLAALEEKSQQDAAERAFWDFWLPWIWTAFSLVLIFAATVAVNWERVKDDILRERHERQRKNPFRGHDPDSEDPMPGPRSPENHVEEGVPYARNENSRVTWDAMVLDYSSSLDTSGRWTVSPTPILRKTRPGAVKSSSVSFKMKRLRVKVMPGSKISLPNISGGVIENIKILPVDEQGLRRPSSTQRVSRQGDKLVFENEGWVEIQYETNYYEPKDVYYRFPDSALPQNERDDLKKYFGELLDPYQELSWKSKLSAIDNFAEDRVIIDLSAHGPEAFRREPHHTSWAHALHEHIQKYGHVRANFSTAVVIKTLFLNYLGLKTVRLKQVSSRNAGENQDSQTLDTGMESMDNFFVGIPVIPENSRTAEQTSDQMIDEGRVYNKVPLGKGMDARGRNVETVWYSDQTLREWDSNRRSPWNIDAPRQYEIFARVVTAAIIPGAFRLLAWTVWLVFKIIKAIVWPFPWMRELARRAANWFLERIAGFQDRRRMNEALKMFEIPKEHFVRRIIGDMQLVTVASNAGWALLGSSKRARYRVLPEILKSSPQQRELLKKLHEYHRAQGPDSELIFFLGLFRLTDPVTNQIWDYEHSFHNLPQSNSGNLIKRSGDEPLRDYEVTLYMKDRRARRHSKLDERGLAGRTEGGIPFSPVYLYTGHSMTFSPKTLQAGEALLDYAHSRGELGSTHEIFELARLIMGTDARGHAALFPDQDAMTGRLFLRALSELKKHGNVNTTLEIKSFLAESIPGEMGRGRRIEELWRFNDEAQPALERYFPYPQREIIEYLIGREGLVLETDITPSQILGPGASLFSDPAVRTALGGKPRSLAWLVDAADVILKKEDAARQTRQPVPPLDLARLQEAVAEGAQGKSEPQNRTSMIDTIKSQKQPGMVRIRETVQNARDITREVPENKRVTELARFGGKRELRVRSYLNNENPDGRLRKITSVQDGVGMPMEILIMKFFPRWATTKSPTARIMQTLKETISVEEKVDTIFQKLVLAAERGNTDLRARILEAVSRVPGAGPREEDAAEILALMGRSLDPDKKSAGLFGIGNYTIYDDADEVVIRTGRDGKAAEIRVKVIRETIEGQEVITDIEMLEFDVFEDPKGRFKGTEIQHIKYVTEEQRHDADLEDRYMKYLFSKYVGAVSDVDIVFYRQTVEDPEPRPLEISIRDERTALAKHGEVTVLSSKLKIERLTVDELYIQDPVHNPAEPGFFKYIPAWGMAWVHERGINFQPRKSTPVTESRGAVRFPERDNRDAGAAAMKVLITAYRREGAKPEGFPTHEEFIKNPKFFFTEAVNDSDIARDAEILNEGGNFSHERWNYYFKDDAPDSTGERFTAAQKYNALFLQVRMPAVDRRPESLMEEKQRLAFENVPAWIKEQYFSNPEFQALFAAESNALPSPADSAYPARAALLLFSTAVLLYSQNKLFFSGQNRGFPGFPFTLEQYLNPSAVKLEADADVLGDIAKIGQTDGARSIDFEAMKNDPGRLARFLLELPGKNGKSIHEVKDELNQSSAEDAESVRRAAGSVSNKYVLGRGDSPLIAAFEDFTKAIKNVMEERLVDSELRRFYFYKPFTVSENNLGLLEDFDDFLSGRDAEGRGLFAKLQKHFASEESVEAGFLFFSALLGTDMHQMRRELLQNHLVNGALETISALAAQKAREGLSVEFSLPRAENRSREETPAAAEIPVTITVSGESKLEVARAAAAKLIGPEETRSELKTEWMQSLWPELREETLSPPVLRLQDAIYSSTEKIAVLSVVPGDLDGADMESYAQGVMAGLAQKELTHEVMILIQGPSAGFAKRFEKAFSERAREMDRTRIAALNSKIHFVSAGSDFIQTILLSGMSKVMLAAPSDFSAEGLPQTTERVVVDRLASGENLFTSSERRGQLGAFVAAAFEAALLPASEINEKDRVLIQNSDRRWYASSPSALQALGRSLGQMLRNIQALAKSA